MILILKTISLDCNSLRIEMYSIDFFFLHTARLAWGADPEAQLSGSAGVYPWRNNIKSLRTIPLKGILVST
jgi:hypothetical protein